MKREISNSDDVIDSRDVIKRIEELESERERLEAEDDVDNVAGLQAAWDEGDEGQELKALKALAEEGEGLADWPHGETLVRDSYFEDYAQELAEDIGAIGKDLPWPACHIDWKAAAEALQQDYSSLDFDGVTYWGRS